MTTIPHGFPWQVLLALAIACACFLAAGFVTLMAAVRWWRARRVRRPGYVHARPRSWDSTPARDFPKSWRRGA